MKLTPLPFLLIAPLAYLLVCALLSALVAYPLHFVTGDALGFHTLVNKGATLIIAMGLIPLGRRLDVGMPEIGLAAGATPLFRQLGYGFALGTLLMGIHVLMLLLLDIRVIDRDKLETVRVVRLSAKALLIGFAVASIEEVVFRGFLLGSLKLRTHRINAVLISSLYFAFLHFLNTDMRPELGDVRWNTGLIIVTDAFRQLSQMHLDSFLALLTAGTFLACVRLLAYPSNLGYCIGLHAGWVFVIKTAKPLTNRGAEPLFPGLASSFDGIIGNLSSAWVSVLIVLLIVNLRSRATENRLLIR